MLNTDATQAREQSGAPCGATYCDGPHTGKNCLNCVKSDGKPAIDQGRELIQISPVSVVTGEEVHLNRWVNRHTYEPSTDLALDLDQGFDREARWLLEKHKIVLPDYTPIRKCIPVSFSSVYFDNNDVTEVIAIGTRWVQPLVLKGYFPGEPPLDFKYAIRGDRVLMRQDQGFGMSRWFLSPQQPVTSAELKLYDGFDERDMTEGLAQLRKVRSGLSEVMFEARAYEKIKQWVNSPSPPKSEHSIQIADYVPIWMSDESIIDKKYFKDLDMSKEWDLGGIVPVHRLEEVKSRLRKAMIEGAGPPKHCYHKTPIVKGKAGEFSKIEEEFLEAKDALLQDNKVMLLIELSDLLGAVECYLEKNFPGVTLDHVVKQAKATNEVFRQGGRENRDPVVDPGTR